MPCRRHSSPVSTPASDSFRMAMICSSLNRLFLTTPPLALAGHRKWRSHISAGLVFGGQVSLFVRPRRVLRRVEVRYFLSQNEVRYFLSQNEVYFVREFRQLRGILFLRGQR